MLGVVNQSLAKSRNEAFNRQSLGDNLSQLAKCMFHRQLGGCYQTLMMSAGIVVCHIKMRGQLLHPPKCF